MSAATGGHKGYAIAKHPDVVIYSAGKYPLVES